MILSFSLSLSLATVIPVPVPAPEPAAGHSDSDSDQRQPTATGPSDSKQHPAPAYANLSHSPGRAGYGIVPAMLFRLHRTLRTMPIPGNPRGTPPRCSSSSHEAGRRRASGAVAAFSRHLRATAPMGRRWDARGKAAADQKAGVPGRQATRTASRLPERPAASRTRDRFRIQTDGQAGRPPPQFGTAPPGRQGNDQRQRQQTASRPRVREPLALTGACRVRHRAGNDPPATPRVTRTRARCLAVFRARGCLAPLPSRPSGRGLMPGTAPIALEVARLPRDPTCARDARTTRCPRSQEHRAPVWCGRPARISVSILSRAPSHEV